MDNPLDLYDFPISHGCYRALCQLRGEPIPPNIDANPWAITEEEDKKQFMEWQDEQYRLFYPRDKEDTVKHQRSPIKTNVSNSYSIYNNKNINTKTTPRRFKLYE